jgi:outer membrane biosynthesis protein TonB
MTSQHPRRPEDSLALAMIELDRLERERLHTNTLREHAERLAALARENAERRATLEALELAAATEPAPHPLHRAAQWLAPFAAMGLVALVGLLAMHEPTLAESSVVPLAAATEPAQVDVISEASPATRIDAAPLVEPAPSEAPLVDAPRPASKPATKPSKPATKPKPSKPATKPQPKPIVLGGGDDPLGEL